MEQASCSRGTSQAVFIFDTISKRSEMITTNGRVNKPSAAKGTCPKAGNWIHTQPPVPDCGPDSSFALLRVAEGGRTQAHPIPALNALAGRTQIRIPLGARVPLGLGPASLPWLKKPSRSCLWNPLLCPHRLEQCLAQSRHSVNICWQRE